MIDNEAVLQFKFYLCRKFLEKLLREGTISEQQRKKNRSCRSEKINVLNPAKIIPFLLVSIGCPVDISLILVIDKFPKSEYNVS